MNIRDKIDTGIPVRMLSDSFQQWTFVVP